MSKVILSIISFFSLTIITGLVIFLIGQLGINDLCDDDLIMQSIRKQLPDNLEILEITMKDLHGFGNESLIVLAIDSDESEVANQLLIFDKINNNVLNKINNLFGYGSNYKLNYSFSLVDPIYGEIPAVYYPFSLEIIDTVDLTEDLSKEIIVKFVPYPCGNAAIYQIGIFGYSYETHEYRLIGTFPPMQLYDNRSIITTILHQGDYNQRNYYNNNEKFQLEYGDKFYNDFFIDDEYYGTLLVRSNKIWEDEGYHDPHKYIISVFRSIYDSDIDELKWEVLFSEQTDEYIDYCTQEYTKNFLEERNPIFNIKLRPISD